MASSIVSRLIVIIPTHGRPTLLGRTLESLSKCDIPKGYAETVVIENGPKSGAETVVRDTAIKYPHLKIRYMHVERANKSHALNEAITTVGDSLIVFFDDDVRLEPDTLMAYATAAETQSGASFFGGPVSIDYEQVPPAWLVPLLPRSAQGYELFDRGVMSGEFLGFNWAARSSDLITAGLFDPDFGPGSPTGATGQESDMQHRLRDLGLRDVGVEGARVWHYVPKNRSTFRWLLRRKYHMGISNGVRCAAGGERPELNWARRFLSLAKQSVMLRPGGVAAVLSGMAYAAGTRNGFSKSLRQ